MILSFLVVKRKKNLKLKSLSSSNLLLKLLQQLLRLRQPRKKQRSQQRRRLPSHRQRTKRKRRRKKKTNSKLKKTRRLKLMLPQMLKRTPKNQHKIQRCNKSKTLIKARNKWRRLSKPRRNVMRMPPKLEKKVFILRTQNRLEIKKLILRLKLQALHPKPLNLDL